jgi:SAM-dependent methyltransferase
MTSGYVHGYAEREAKRLTDQANTLVELLHHDTSYRSGASVLEAGCGVGAQILTLAGNSPSAAITSIDISTDSLRQATARCAAAGIANVTFEPGDVFNLRFADESFDHVFVCFLLEHLANPAGALRALLRVLKRDGTITVIEGDHGSTGPTPPARSSEPTDPRVNSRPQDEPSSQPWRWNRQRSHIGPSLETSEPVVELRRPVFRYANQSAGRG